MKINLLTWVAIALFSLAADAGGGWISSGGEIFKFAKNPWFVKNTKDVDYCVQVDAASFSASDATARDVIKEAIQYWKHEFDQPNPTGTPGFAQLATQNFHEIATCTDKTPLRFLFGYGVLTKDEVAGLVDPTKYVGISVRTDYNNEQLSGSGFVYISSDFGPHAYDANDPSSHHLARAWEKRTLLLYAVLHEMGHVFGIPHMGSGIMSEVFLDQLLHKSFYQFYIDNQVQSFLNPPLNFTSCSISGMLNTGFFQAPPDTGCISFEGTQVGSQITWKVGAPAGLIVVTRNMQLQMGSVPAVVVQLPSEQKVFSIQERFVNTFMLGPIFTEGTANGNFQTPTSHRPNDLQVELRTDSIVMTGLVGGRMTPVMVYRTPSLLSNVTLPPTP
jgi:hypothetical protein